MQTELTRYLTNVELWLALKRFTGDNKTIIKTLMNDIGRNRLLIESMLNLSIESINWNRDKQERVLSKGTIEKRMEDKAIKEKVIAKMIPVAKAYVDKDRERYEQSILYLWKIKGIHLGDCTGLQIEEAARNDQLSANGHLNNVDFYKRLRKKVGDDDICKDKITIEEAEKIKENIYGSDFNS